MRYVFTPARSLAIGLIIAGSTILLRCQELTAEKIYENSLPSVLTLRVENKAGEKYVGSAFLAVKEGIAVTAWHVIFDAVKVTAKFADGASCELNGFVD